MAGRIARRPAIAPARLVEGGAQEESALRARARAGRRAGRRAARGALRHARHALAAGLLALAGIGCSGAGPGSTGGPGPLLAQDGAAAPANLKLVAAEARPRLALLARTGDPAPALVAIVATDMGSAPTVALAAVVEARMLAAGLAVDTRVDRSSFRVRWLGGTDAASVKAFFGALMQAFQAPLGPTTPEIAKASERVAALKRNPLPAPEAAPAADCAGRLGLAPRERALDPATPEGLAELEAARARALTAQRTALAAVGPEPLCAAAEAALSEIDGWPSGLAAEDPWPAADALGTHAANDVAKGRARFTVALRVAEPVAAVAAAERLGDAVGPLRARLSALPLPFRVTEVLGVARPRGGCISVTAESESAARDAAAASALAAAVARKEIAAEARVPWDASLASRAVIAATDPRDAAARAAWWALSGSANAAPAPRPAATQDATPPSAAAPGAPANQAASGPNAGEGWSAAAPAVTAWGGAQEGASTGGSAHGDGPPHRAAPLRSTSAQSGAFLSFAAAQSAGPRPGAAAQNGAAQNAASQNSAPAQHVSSSGAAPQGAAAQNGAFLSFAAAQNAGPRPGAAAQNGAFLSFAAAQNAGPRPGAAAQNGAFLSFAAAQNAGPRPGAAAQSGAFLSFAAAQNAGPRPGAAAQNAASQNAPSQNSAPAQHVSSSGAAPQGASAQSAASAQTASAPKLPERWATVLALAPDDRGDLTAAAKRFETDFVTYVRAADAPVVERRASVEQGQGEVWVLLASPCGTGDETPNDAGASALAAIAAAGRARRDADLSVEPWVTAEGIGVLAHAPALAGAGARREDEAALARRVASAAARAFAGAVPTKDAVSEARVIALTQIERTLGPQGAVLDGLLGALSPDHPSQLHPLGTFTRLAALSAPSVEGRWQSLAAGPLRMAILANATTAQANAAFAAADHWLSPRPAPRPCPTATDATLRPGHYQVEPPPGAELAQAFVAAQVPVRGQPGREAAALAAHLLGTGAGSGVERGLIQAALDRTPLPATASARLLGGARSSALVIDVRAPESALDDAVAEVKNALASLGQDGPTDAALAAALARKQRAEQEASYDPRTRLAKLWLGEAPAPPAPLTRDTMRTFFAQTFREAALVVVQAKRK